MKKIVIILLLILMPLSIKALEYDVQSADMKVTFPDNWYVFTRENVKDNETLENLNVTEEYMNNFFTNYNAYIDALNTNVELVLRLGDKVDFHSLSDYPDEKVLEYASDFGAINKTDDYKVYTNKYKYVIVNYTSSNYHILMYATVINSKWYTYSAQKIGEFTAEEASDIKKIIDSIEYTIIEEPEEKEIVEKEVENKGDTKKLVYAYLVLVVIAIAFGLNLFILKKKRGNQ